MKCSVCGKFMKDTTGWYREPDTGQYVRWFSCTNPCENIACEYEPTIKSDNLRIDTPKQTITKEIEK